jgi:hypothetical protein
MKRALLLLVLLGCSGGAAPPVGGFPAEPLLATSSDSGGLKIELRTSPQPPARGSSEAELTVTRTNDGATADGLDVAVEPWMPAMGHGSSVVPTVTPEGGGKYHVTGVYLFMPGTWELRITFTSGASRDHAAPSFDVP